MVLFGGFGGPAQITTRFNKFGAVSARRVAFFEGTGKTVSSNAGAIAVKLRNIAPLAERNLDLAMHDAAYALRDAIRAELNRPYAPSSKGTEKLAPSWKARRYGSQATGTTSWSVYSDSPYARRVELGFWPGDKYTGGVDVLGREFGKDESKAPYSRGRPYIQPAIEKSGPAVKALVRDAVTSAIANA